MLGGKKPPGNPGWAHPTVGPWPGTRAPGRPSAARRAPAGPGRVSLGGAGTGEHHMPALPSVGKSRDLSVAASIPTGTCDVVQRLGSPDEEQHALPWFLSDSGHGRRAGKLCKPSRPRAPGGGGLWAVPSWCVDNPPGAAKRPTTSARLLRGICGGVGVDGIEGAGGHEGERGHHGQATAGVALLVRQRQTASECLGVGFRV